MWKCWHLYQAAQADRYVIPMALSSLNKLFMASGGKADPLWPDLDPVGANPVDDWPHGRRWLPCCSWRSLVPPLERGVVVARLLGLWRRAHPDLNNDKIGVSGAGGAAGLHGWCSGRGLLHMEAPQWPPGSATATRQLGRPATGFPASIHL
ncbi:hypothetical protein ZWY2020_022349 [Hordeum vulgare]|nr:hypothetical protein ZWY2020_022349 [Hordeum vulgare]